VGPAGLWRVAVVFHATLAGSVFLDAQRRGLSLSSEARSWCAGGVGDSRHSSFSNPEAAQAAERRAWTWIGAAAICGVAAGLWQLQADMQEFALGMRLREHLWLWHGWLAAPWVYLLVQAGRVRGFALGLGILGIVAMGTVLGGVLLWQLRISQLPLEPRITALAMLPLLQGGLMAVCGLGLWVARRWMV
jgi:hypothetical protein